MMKDLKIGRNKMQHWSAVFSFEDQKFKIQLYTDTDQYYFM